MHSIETYAAAKLLFWIIINNNIYLITTVRLCQLHTHSPTLASLCF